jgi:putative nucleotidyltransferase with HDIG domain
MIRLTLIAALIVLNLLFCFAEDLYLAYRPLQEGERAPFTLRSGGTPALSLQGEPANPPPALMIPFLKILDAHDISLVRAFQDAPIERKYHQTPFILFVNIFMVVFLGFYLLVLPRAGYRRPISVNALLMLLILQSILLKVFLLFTPLPTEALPLAWLPLLVIAMNQGRLIAVGVLLTGSTLAALFIERTYGFMIGFLIIGLTAAMVAPQRFRLRDIILPSIVIGIVNAACVTALAADWRNMNAVFETLQAADPGRLPQLAANPVVLRAAWAFAGGVGSGVLAVVLLPLIRLGWHVVSTFSLRRFSDLDHPLLKKLVAEAPGTYQHSMTVAYLAQAAAAAVGANALLLRIGAYFHDIGKMDRPKNFIENQLNCENPHDELDPYESVEAILGHARKGVIMAIGARLPKAVIALIREHHGTQVIDFFYHKALKSKPKGTVREEDFRYPGPKPQSLESALLMIADAVEAASRSLKEPSRREFEKMVRLIVLKRIADGQLSECGIDTRDIDRIMRALVDSLEVSFHSRIAYPWQQAKTSAE